MAYISIFYIAIVFMFSFGYRQNQPHALINYLSIKKNQLLMFYNSCNLLKYLYIITCTSYILSANAHSNAFTLYNVISSSAKDNRDAFFAFSLLNYR